MKSFLVLLMLCGLSFGAYSTAPIEMYSCGYGYVTTDGSTKVAQGTTVVDLGSVANQQGRGVESRIAGTLKQMHARFYVGTTNIPATTGSCVLKLFKDTNADSVPDTYANASEALSQIDITSQVVAAAATAITAGGNRAFDVDIDLSASNLTVNYGDIFGIFITSDSSASVQICYVASTDRHIRRATGNTWTVSSTTSNAALAWDFTVTTIAKMQRARYLQVDAFGKSWAVPACKTEPYFLHIPKLRLPDTQDCEVRLLCTDSSTGAEIAEKTIALNFINSDAHENLITMDAYTSSKSIASGESDYYNLHIRIDPTTDKIDVWYVNISESADIKHISLNNRTPVALIDGAVIRQVKLVQNTGTTATIPYEGTYPYDSIYFSVQPILAIGDSYTGTYTTLSTLANVGAQLNQPGVFTEQRYVINAGIAGNGLLEAYSASGSTTPVYKRWDSAGNDLCYYSGVILAMVNGGGGLNDLQYDVTGAGTELQYKTEANRITAQAMAIALNAAHNGLDVIIGEPLQLPTPTISENWQKGIVQWQTMLRLLAAGYPNVYWADTSSYANGYGGIHPDAAGSLWIANQMADAYENSINIDEFDVGGWFERF